MAPKKAYNCVLFQFLKSKFYNRLIEKSIIMEVEEALMFRVGETTPEEEEPPSATDRVSHVKEYQQTPSDSRHPLRKPHHSNPYPTPRTATTKHLVNSMQPCSE